ncbi:MAG: ABC transporter ATP-binding protein [Acidimicrobiia bacterium]|nr:MAG: ABC transporter ATP-binding protein [Acidimicrobiia bacterium]
MLLDIQNVEAGYGSAPPVLRGLSLQVEDNRSYCVIGPNGAGKSTLLKTIVGILRPRRGTIRFQGESIEGLRPDEILQKGICFVPQDRSLFPEMTVQENLRMGGFLIRDRRLLRERLDRVYELFPILRDRTNQVAGTLSGGQQQMLALARTLMIEPKLLCVDEPSLGLAPGIVDQVFETLTEFRKQGMTVLLVEQNAVRGLSWADWGFVLDLGALRFEGPADGILENPQIRELYLGRLAARGEE